MWYVQGVRWVWWPLRSILRTRPVPSHPPSQDTHLPHSLHNSASEYHKPVLCLYRTQRRSFSAICSARCDPSQSCSLNRFSNVHVYCGRHEVQLKNRLMWTGNECTARSLMTTPVQYMFWERDPKGGYGKKIKESRRELIREGLKELRTELSKWREEVQEKFEDDPIYVRPGDMDKIWVMGNEDVLKRWVVTSDSDHGEGFSTATLTISPTGHGLFSGQISTEVPKDGRVKKAGYCNMRSTRPRKSFKRDDYHDWSLYTHLELRVRGDGRSYLLNIGSSGYFDVNWNDIYSYILYTRGGPHWQIARIPFSKFFVSSKGRVQDKQCPLLQTQITSLGISAGDRINAPFRLEIDYIGVYDDPEHMEKFAYEMYRVPKFMGY